MHIRTSPGSGAAGFGLIGTGLTVALDEKWIGWVVVGVGVLVFMFDVRIDGWNIKFAHKFSFKARAVAAILIGAAVLWFDYWYYSSVLNAPVHAIIPQPPKPPPPPPEPPKPPEPWVSEEEAKLAKKNGRLLLPFRPAELSEMNFMGGSQGTSAYVGQWVKINDRFLSAQSAEQDKKELLIVTILQVIWPAYLVFDAKKWGDQIRVMNPHDGAIVHAMCQLRKYEKPPRDTVEPKFVGVNCELL
jgi:hypothetical protein